MLSRMSRTTIGIFLFLAIFTVSSSKAGRYGRAGFDGSGSSLAIVTHPFGYTGNGTTLNVRVCLGPNMGTQEQVAVKNAIATWNCGEPTLSNLLIGGANNIGQFAVDAESVILHELGHCLGLGHPNISSEENNNVLTYFTASTRGSNGSFNFNDGSDNVAGSSDDLRGDDGNMNWFQIFVNNPFVLPARVDSSTYSRSTLNLPASNTYSANGNRQVASLLGFPNTESVMVQGIFLDEVQRRLGHDDVATLRYAMTGLDEIEDTADDYLVNLVLSTPSQGCDIWVNYDFGLNAPAARCALPGYNQLSTFHYAVSGASTVFLDSDPSLPQLPAFWHFTPPSEERPLCCNLRGDVNCDGTVGSTDIALTRAFLVGNPVPSNMDYKNANTVACSVGDRNPDNVTSTDVALFRHFVVNLFWPLCDGAFRQAAQADEYFALIPTKSSYEVHWDAVEEMTFALVPGDALPPDPRFLAFSVRFEGLPSYLSVNMVTTSTTNPGGGWLVTGSSELTDSRHVVLVDDSASHSFSAFLPVFRVQFAVDPEAPSIFSATVAYTAELTDQDFVQHMYSGTIFLDTSVFADGFESGDTSAWSN